MWRKGNPRTLGECKLVQPLWRTMRRLLKKVKTKLLCDPAVPLLVSCWCCLFFFLLYNIVFVLPYINMHPPRVYTCSPSWTPLPPPSPYHPSGSSQCTSPRLPVSCIKPGLAIRFLYDITHVSVPFSPCTVLYTHRFIEPAPPQSRHRTVPSPHRLPGAIPV